MSEKNKPSRSFLAVKWFLKKVYPRPKFEGELPKEPCIIVGNHSQIHGPLMAELHFPEPIGIWCAGAMMKLKTVPSYAFEDFWSQKSKWSQPYFKLCSYLIAPLAAFLFTNAQTIGVFRDGRILSTFKKTVEELKNGKNILIFPEHDVKYNHILYDFEEHFIDVAKLYYKRTQKEVLFVPAYLAPKLKQVTFGKPIRFDGTADIDAERTRIRKHLMDEIVSVAEGLPLHTVVPYRNIPKRNYPKNKGDQA